MNSKIYKHKFPDSQLPALDSLIPTPEFVIPVEGSLGLLALGAQGLREWRKIRNLHNQTQDTSIKNQDKTIDQKQDTSIKNQDKTIEN